jgi:hypothetical protein
MQYLLEVDDNKDRFLMEILKHFRFVKTRPLSKANVQFINELQESIEQVKLAKQRKIKLSKAGDILDEL